MKLLIPIFLPFQYTVLLENMPLVLESLLFASEAVRMGK